MVEWVTTKDASLIKKVPLSQHRIAELARQGEIVAQRAGKKKWLVKVTLKDEMWGLVKLDKPKEKLSDSMQSEQEPHEEINETALREVVEKRQVTSWEQESGVVPSWQTVKLVVDGFLSLSPSQVTTLPDPLQARWREVAHQTDAGHQEMSEAVSCVKEDVPQTVVEDRSGETPHKQQMRELAKATAEGIRLPSIYGKDLWSDLPFEFRPGKYSLSIGMVEIDENEQIKVSYCLGAGNAEPHLVKGLYSHLSTSGLFKFAKLVGDKGKLNSLADEAGRYSQALLKFLKLITDEVKACREVNFHDEAEPGITKWFNFTVWKDAIQKAGGYPWIGDSLYKPPEPSTPSNLWQLRCGPYIIGIAKSKKTLKIYENWHKNQRVKYAEHPLAQDIDAKYRELTNITLDIRQRLQEFSDMQYLPGHCELCSPVEDMPR